MILDYSEYVVDKASKGIVNYNVVDKNEKLFKHDSICPFCKVTIDNQIHHKYRQSYPEWLFGSFDESETVVQCPNCGWWEYKYCNQSDAIIDGIRASDIEYASAIIRKYEDDSSKVPISALRNYIEKRPDVIYNIDAHKMEELVRSVLVDFYPSCKVISFGKTRDGGKDAVLIDDNGKQILIQIKRRTKPDSTEGVEPLRALIGVSVVEDNVKGGIFVSTADHFSEPAKQYAMNVLNKQHIETFDLIDCKSFLKMVDLTRDKLPTAWSKLLHLKD